MSRVVGERGGARDAARPPLVRLVLGVLLAVLTAGVLACWTTPASHQAADAPRVAVAAFSPAELAPASGTAEPAAHHGSTDMVTEDYHCAACGPDRGSAHCESHRLDAVRDLTPPAPQPTTARQSGAPAPHPASDRWPAPGTGPSATAPSLHTLQLLRV